MNIYTQEQSSLFSLQVKVGSLLSLSWDEICSSELYKDVFFVFYGDGPEGAPYYSVDDITSSFAKEIRRLMLSSFPESSEEELLLLPNQDFLKEHMGIREDLHVLHDEIRSFLLLSFCVMTYAEGDTLSMDYIDTLVAMTVDAEGDGDGSFVRICQQAKSLNDGSLPDYLFE